MSNIIQFTGKQRVTVEDTMRVLNEEVAAGEVDFLLVTVMRKNTSVTTAMTTGPAHCLVYMNQLQRMKIEELMREAGMI